MTVLLYNTSSALWWGNGWVAAQIAFLFFGSLGTSTTVHWGTGAGCWLLTMVL
jgi:hypothetical protein